MIGDLRTDALHQALQDDIRTNAARRCWSWPSAARTSRSRAAATGGWDRQRSARAIAEGGVLTSDHGPAAPDRPRMLVSVLSCRDNMTNSGVVARVAGDAIDAVALPAEHGDRGVPVLPVAARSSAAAAEGVRVEARVKDTRARMVERFKDGTYVYPGALFKLAPAEIDDARRNAARRYGPSRSWGSDDDPTDGLDEAMEGGEGAKDDEAALGQGQDFESAGASATAAGRPSAKHPSRRQPGRVPSRTRTPS